MIKWQPIETAPMDQLVLIWSPSTGYSLAYCVPDTRYVSGKIWRDYSHEYLVHPDAEYWTALTDTQGTFPRPSSS